MTAADTRRSFIIEYVPVGATRDSDRSRSRVTIRRPDGAGHLTARAQFRRACRCCRGRPRPASRCLVLVITHSLALVNYSSIQLCNGKALAVPRHASAIPRLPSLGNLLLRAPIAALTTRWFWGDILIIRRGGSGKDKCDMLTDKHQHVVARKL